jgi:outer membrane protein assembly factor BamE (lipoprotein component of BamABCDE complex)
MFFISRHFINSLLIIIFCIAIGCKLQEPLKTHGIVYLENRSNKLAVSNSNKNDVINIMGQPQIRDGENKESWIYIERTLSKGKYHKLGQHVLKDSNVLVLSFDKYGILSKKNFITKENLNKIKFSSKVTENALTEKSFVTKFLQSIKQKMYSNK